MDRVNKKKCKNKTKGLLVCVLMTGMILPQDTFSNVKIDNGKVISDGSRTVSYTHLTLPTT